MNDFKVRALEIHSMYIMDFKTVVKSLDFMQENGLNTLILHRNDLIDMMVYPAKFFGGTRESYDNIFDRFSDIYKKVTEYTQYRKNSTYQRRAYFKRVFFEAKKRGIDVYIENKEIIFPEIILEFYPHLVKNGAICVNEPFWIDFITEKYTEFFSEFPECKGIITSVSTRESRASIVANRCKCDLCKNSSKQDWTRNVLEAMYRPIHKAGAQLVVRDFVYHAATHNEITDVLANLPEDVIIAIKNTPHDYYPTFPDNERIANCDHHRKWIEFDVWGQFYGFGTAPAILIEDLKYRLNHAKKYNSEGAMFRIDWEHLDSHTAFENLNLINLIAAAKLSCNLGTDNDEIYRKYLDTMGFFAEDTSGELKDKAVKWFGSIMDKTWDITKRAAFVDGFVVNNCSCLPITYETAIWTAVDLHSIRDWDPSKNDTCIPTESNMKIIFGEKDEAVRMIKDLYSKVRRGHAGVSSSCLEYLDNSFKAFETYVDACKVTAEAVFSVRYVLDSTEKSGSFYKEMKTIVKEKMQALYEMIDILDKFYQSTSYPSVVYVLLDADRIRTLHKDLSRKLAEKS